MHPTAAFLTDVGLVAVLSLALVAYVKPHLNALLMELCGTAERARFWLAFSNVTLVLVPLIFALDYNPDSASGTNLVFDMATQLKHAIIGFVMALTLLAIILFRSRAVDFSAERTEITEKNHVSSHQPAANPNRERSKRNDRDHRRVQLHGEVRGWNLA